MKTEFEKKYLIGNSIDIHRLKKEDNLIEQIIGATTIKTNYRVIAHSDGDLVLHAIANAIIGGLNLGDIGDYFSDESKLTKNLDSKIILNKAILLMNELNYEINNIDITIVCEHIIFKDYKKNIAKNLSSLLNNKNISVKTTRFEENVNKIECLCSLLMVKKY